MISNRAEHHAVLHTLEHLEKREGFEVTWLDVSPDGLIDPDELERAIRSDTTLVSIMTANNETGVIQPMEEISARCRKHGVLLHSDMVQSFGKLAEQSVPGDRSAATATRPASARTNFTDRKALAFSICAPVCRSIAFNLAAPMKANAAREPRMSRRSSGWQRPRKKSCGICLTNRTRERKLRDELWRGIERVCPEAQQNAATAPRLANTLNVSFPGFTSETLLMALDLEGVCASSGSACMVGSVVASHVLLAMGLPPERAASAIRFSLGKETTASEIEATIAAIERILRRRKIPVAASSAAQHALV